MDQTVTIKLIAQTTTYDAIRQAVHTETEREVYAQLRSITRAEWFEAGRNGLRPDIAFVMMVFDYHGEEIIEWNGRRYGVYRTFIGRNDTIELYCEKQGGRQLPAPDPEVPANEESNG